LLRDLHLLGDSPLGLQFLGGRPTLRLDFLAYLVASGEAKRIPVWILEGGEGTAPGGRVGRVQEMNSPPVPLLVLRPDVLGHKDDLSGATNEAFVPGSGLGRDKRQDRGAVGRGEAYPTPGAFESKIDEEPEPELLHVKPQAAVLIANEDRNVMQAEMGIASIH
jgi:hypothetical protein